MRRACEWVCYMKSGSPDPCSLIRPEHWKPAKPPVNWNDFHTHAAWKADD